MTTRIGLTNVDGITVSTVHVPGQGFETCLFDDRAGTQRLSPSAVVETYSDVLDAILGHAEWSDHGAPWLLAALESRR